MGLAAFGAALKRRRVELKLTQTELGERAGVHRDQISRVESGATTPVIETMDRLLVAVGWTLHDLADAIEGYRPQWEMQTDDQGRERVLLHAKPEAVIAESRVTYAAELEERVARLEDELDVQRRLAAVERKQAMLTADREDIRERAIEIVTQMLAEDRRAGSGKG